MPAFILLLQTISVNVETGGSSRISRPLFKPTRRQRPEEMTWKSLAVEEVISSKTSAIL